MRILILGINFSPETIGIGKYSGEMAEWLARRGHQVRVVTAPPHNPFWFVPARFKSWTYSREDRQYPDLRTKNGNRESVPKIKIIRCPLWVPRKPNGTRRLLYVASFGLSTWPVMLWQLIWRPEIVFVVEPTLACVPQALLVATCSRAISWLHVQDFELDAAFALGDLSSSWIKQWAQKIERILLRRFDRISAITDPMAERLGTKGVDRTRRLVFPNWVDTKMIYPLLTASPFREELGISPETTVLLYAGSMGKKQGLEQVAEAARRHVQYQGLLYVLTGEGPFRQTLMEMTKDLPNVIHLPLQSSERLNDLLNLADIHLLPQRAEAKDLVMPSKLTGMMASGRPIIATANSGTQLAAAVHGRGLVVKPDDLEAFVSAILSLANSKELRLKLGQEARKYALSQLDLEPILRTFELAMLAACRGTDREARDERIADYVNLD